MRKHIPTDLGFLETVETLLSGEATANPIKPTKEAIVLVLLAAILNPEDGRLARAIHLAETYVESDERAERTLAGEFSTAVEEIRVSALRRLRYSGSGAVASLYGPQPPLESC